MFLVFTKCCGVFDVCFNGMLSFCYMLSSLPLTFTLFVYVVHACCYDFDLIVILFRICSLVCLFCFIFRDVFACVCTTFSMLLTCVCGRSFPRDIPPGKCRF